MNALGIILHFAAAHFLPGYDGPCGKMHGHTWRVEFKFRYNPNKLDACGIAVDFKGLKAALKPILPDHLCLNDIMPKPSAEMLVEYFLRRLIEIGVFPPVESIQVWESETAYAEWHA